MTMRPPNDDTLLAFAAGTLSSSHALVVETHLALCEPSRAWVHELEEIGGRIVSDLEPVALEPDALARILARIEAPHPEEPDAPAVSEMPGLPEPLRRYRMGPWKWAGRGTRIRQVLVPNEGEARVLIFSIDPGRRMPQHTHTGVEFTCVISGSYSDESGRFGPGDFEEADDDVSHRPVVDSDVPCVCVVALDGEVKLEGMLGRVLQPFVRL